MAPSTRTSLTVKLQATASYYDRGNYSHAVNQLHACVNRSATCGVKVC